MLFSIIVPTYNRSAELATALRSCLAQDCPDFEVIVIDDCSHAPAAPVCADLGDARITCIRNERNLGASGSRNRGLAMARGDYVVFLDSDDVFLPSKLSSLKAVIEADAPDVVLHRQYRIFDDRPGSFAFEILPKRSMAKEERIEEFVFRDGNYYQINAVCVSRAIAATAGFRTDMRLLEDQAFLFDCVRASSRTVILNTILGVYVDDERQSRASKAFRTAEDFAAFLDYAGENLSARGREMAAAALLSETSLLRDPLRVGAAILKGARAGVPRGRTALYLFRSLFGMPMANRIVRLVRARHSGGSAEGRPEWAALLRCRDAA